MQKTVMQEIDYENKCTGLLVSGARKTIALVAIFICWPVLDLARGDEWVVMAIYTIHPLSFVPLAGDVVYPNHPDICVPHFR